MTKKDYIRLARALRETKGFAWHLVRDSISNELADDNPCFERERFIQACETEPRRKREGDEKP